MRCVLSICVPEDGCVAEDGVGQCPIEWVHVVVFDKLAQVAGGCLVFVGWMFLKPAVCGPVNYSCQPMDRSPLRLQWTTQGAALHRRCCGSGGRAMGYGRDAGERSTRQPSLRLPRRDPQVRR